MKFKEKVKAKLINLKNKIKRNYCCITISTLSAIGLGTGIVLLSTGNPLGLILMILNTIILFSTVNEIRL